MMVNTPEKRMIVGLDIGTSKVVAVVGEVDGEGTIEVVGIGSHPSRGMKKGVVVDIESTVNAIQRAVEEAELMAGCQIHSVYVGIAGSHIRSMNSHGIVAIREGEVVPADVERVLDAAQAVAIPADQKVLHVLPQEYVIDNQGGIDISVGDNINIITNDRDINFVTGNGTMFFGSVDLEPMVKGQQLVDILSELIDTIGAMQFLTPSGPSALGPVNSPDFGKVKSKLNSILSQRTQLS